MPVHVAVLGASSNPDRYSNKAIKMLVEAGHRVLPINTAGGEIEGLPVFSTLSDVKAQIHTITVYVGPANIKSLIPGIIAARPQRVIANPGAESIFLKAAAQAANIEYLEACTLVLLSTGQF